MDCQLGEHAVKLVGPEPQTRLESSRSAGQRNLWNQELWLEELRSTFCKNWTDTFCMARETSL